MTGDRIEALGHEIRGLTHGLDKETKERAVADEEITRTVKDALETLESERADRNASHNSLHDRLLGLHKDIAGEREHRTAMQISLADMESKVHPKLKDIQEKLERIRLSDPEKKPVDLKIDSETKNTLIILN